MSVFEAVASGLVQGFTEFLPVSSSGHLVFVHALFGVGEPRLFFDVALHFSTMLAVLFFFRKEIKGVLEPGGVRWRRGILIGTLPGVAAGLLFKERIEFLFGSPRIVSGLLVVTAMVLLGAQAVLSRKERRISGITAGNSLFVGVAQAAAIMPGLSRSGMTISAGISSGMEAEESFRFSFLLSVPIIAGATLHEIISGAFLSEELVPAEMPVIGLGMAAAFVSGLLGLLVLKRAVVTGKLWVFGVYCFIAGVTGLTLWR